MLKLLTKLTRNCLSIAVVPALVAGAAHATGSARTTAYPDTSMHGISAPMDMPRPRPLLYTDAEPVQIEGGPEQIYLTSTTGAYTGGDLDCMAEALYFEARGEGRKGQAAVAEVILNRVKSSRFPNSVCGVINQRSQFSYTIGGRKTIRSRGTYLRVRQVAETALSGGTGNLTNGATYFHTPAVRPAWSRRFQRTIQIGRHIFYRTGQRIASN
ncbi:hydrolase [Paracoccus tegillarcae]|uniref:Hydrolase n=2 Tax=Paracoccus tegillarcae TaxID=1529068 RepID=A0A2K9F724_9RHOB|nr:hydrolase [Paracoccus tegillarcae]